MGAMPRTDEGPDPVSALLRQIRRERGLDLSLYKASYLERRLAVRLRARGCPDHASYAQLLRREPEEYGPLLDALTINLTHFFRDATTYQAIEEHVLPALLQMRAAEQRLCIWSAGCATGEEPYSLAILLREQMGRSLRHWKVSILATDVDADALEKARQALYGPFSFQGVNARHEAWIERYFTSNATRQLDERVRQMVTFQHLDLVQDPPPQELDLLLCRNVLIYFEHDLQERLYRAFYQALQPGGFLVLGKTEILPMKWNRHFALECPGERIYRRVAIE